MGLKKMSVVLLILGFVNGCASIGPSTVARDRFDYTTAISDSWKAQMLLNVVKLRYADAPVFLGCGFGDQPIWLPRNSGSFGLMVSESREFTS